MLIGSALGEGSMGSAWDDAEQAIAVVRAQMAVAEAAHTVGGASSGGSVRTGNGAGMEPTER